MKTRVLILVMFLALGFTACRDKKVVEAEKIVLEWIGKEIQFPENLQTTVLGKDSILNILRTKKVQKDFYLIFNYDGSPIC